MSKTKFDCKNYLGLVKEEECNLSLEKKNQFSKRSGLIDSEFFLVSFFSEDDVYSIIDN